MAGGVQDGQAVSAGVTNPAFLYKNGDDATLAKLGLNDQTLDGVSGAAVGNAQREFNALWSWLGGLLNQAKDFLPMWATSFFGSESDDIFTRISAIDAAYNPEGGALASRAGVVDIAQGATSVVVDLSAAWSDANYIVVPVLENLTDSTPIQLPQPMIRAKSTTQFTAEWFVPTDTANYKLSYVLRKAA